MPRPFQYVPEDVKKEAAQEADQPKPGKPKKVKKGPEDLPNPLNGTEGGGGRRRRPFQKTRANQALTREEVKAIKRGRKKLRKEMRARGIKGRQDFELTAETLGLYFDKNSSLFAWLWSHWLTGLAAMLAVLLLILFLFSTVVHARGYFTINLADNLMNKGFSISDTEDFSNPSIQIAATPSEDTHCISINQLPIDLDQQEGNHNADNYFAYTFFVRNEGGEPADYYWSVEMNSESKGLNDAVWVVLFVDGEMRIYAKANRLTGQAEALPPKDDDQRGYMTLPIMSLAPDSPQFETVRQRNGISFYRVIPESFLTDRIIAQGMHEDVEPQETHKYTVVLYLEGDDPDTTDDKVGGHMGVEVNIQAEFPEEETEENRGALHSVKNYFSNLWSDLKFW